MKVRNSNSKRLALPAALCVPHGGARRGGPARLRADLLQPALRGERPVAALGKAAGRRRRLAVLAQPEAVSAARVQVQRRRRRGVRRRRRGECELPRVLERPGRPRDGVVLVVDEQRRRRLRIDGQLGRELGRRLVVVLQQLRRSFWASDRALRCCATCMHSTKKAGEYQGRLCERCG